MSGTAFRDRRARHSERRCWLDHDKVPPGRTLGIRPARLRRHNKSAIRRKKYVHPVFERAITYLNDVGLLAEEVDPATGELLSDFPQAFSHIGLPR